MNQTKIGGKIRKEKKNVGTWNVLRGLSFGTRRSRSEALQESQSTFPTGHQCVMIILLIQASRVRVLRTLKRWTFSSDSPGLTAVVARHLRFPHLAPFFHPQA